MCLAQGSKYSAVQPRTSSKASVVQACPAIQHRPSTAPRMSLSFIICYSRFRLTTNSVLARIFFIRYAITHSTAHPSRIRIPDLQRPMFPLYPTSPPAAEAQSRPFTLAPTRGLEPRPCQRRIGDYSVASAAFPHIAGYRQQKPAASASSWELFADR